MRRRRRSARLALASLRRPLTSLVRFIVEKHSLQHFCVCVFSHLRRQNEPEIGAHEAASLLLCALQRLPVSFVEHSWTLDNKQFVQDGVVPTSVVDSFVAAIDNPAIALQVRAQRVAAPTDAAVQRLTRLVGGLPAANRAVLNDVLRIGAAVAQVTMLRVRPTARVVERAMSLSERRNVRDGPRRRQPRAGTIAGIVALAPLLRAGLCLTDSRSCVTRRQTTRRARPTSPVSEVCDDESKR